MVQWKYMIYWIQMCVRSLTPLDVNRAVQKGELATATTSRYVFTLTSALDMDSERG